MATSGEELRQDGLGALGFPQLNDVLVMAEFLLNKRFDGREKTLPAGVIGDQSPQVPDGLIDFARRRMVGFQVEIFAHGGKTASGTFHVGQVGGEVVQMLDDIVAVFDRVRSVHQTGQAAVGDRADSGKDEQCQCESGLDESIQWRPHRA